MKRKGLRLNVPVALMLPVALLLLAGAWYTGLIPLERAGAAPGDLTVTVTKVFPTPNHVGLHLELKDDGVVVIDKDYMHQWASGTDVPDEVKQEIGARMQEDIDAYKALAARYNAAAYDTAASQVEAGLVL